MVYNFVSLEKVETGNVLAAMFKTGLFDRARYDYVDGVKVLMAI